jgi:hypothetical protein
VPEGHLVVALDEQIGGDQLTYRGEDLGRRRAERSRQLIERERPPQ